MAYGTVPPETDTLTLEGGDTITIKRRLNTGEMRALLRRSRGTGGTMDGLDYAFYLTLAHLVDWHSPSGRWPALAGVDDALRVAILDAIDPDDYTAIKDAITAHVTRLAAEREAEKKTVGPRTPAAISPSPFAAAGGSSGSARLTLTSTPPSSIS